MTDKRSFLKFTATPNIKELYERDTAHREMRLNIKNKHVDNIARTPIAQKAIKVLVAFDDLVQELATIELEITPDNIVSKTVRKIFGLSVGLDALQTPKRTKEAKSKWHEILMNAEKIGYKKPEVNLPQTPDISFVPGVSVQSVQSEITEVSTEPTNALENSSETVSDAT